MDHDRSLASGPLEQISICDFTGQLAGAGATRILAAFGARVIRIEDPATEGRWDILRGLFPYVDERRGVNLGGAFNNHNVEKLGITLNLRTERGRDLLRRLVEKSDVVSENFAGGVLARLGFSYDELRAIRPDIIYVSNCGFGNTGPYKSWKTWGPVVQAICGLSFQSGLPDLPPAGWGYSYMDHMGGNFMALAILSALVHRNHTGQGQWVDMACTEAGATLDGPSILDFTVNNRPARRPGNPDSNHSQAPVMVPHNIYPAAGDDNWVAIACRDDADWAALSKVIAEPWSSDPALATRDGRRESEERLDEQMAAWTRQRNHFALATELQTAGVPASAVQRPEERIDHDPATSDWGLWPVAHHSEMGDVRVDGLPIHLSESKWSIERGAPCLGEHNDLVYSELLGLTPQDLDGLRAEGVI